MAGEGGFKNPIKPGVGILKNIAQVFSVSLAIYVPPTKLVSFSGVDGETDSSCRVNEVEKKYFYLYNMLSLPRS